MARLPPLPSWKGLHFPLHFVSLSSAEDAEVGGVDHLRREMVLRMPSRPEPQLLSTSSVTQGTTSKFLIMTPVLGDFGGSLEDL